MHQISRSFSAARMTTDIVVRSVSVLLSAIFVVSPMSVFGQQQREADTEGQRLKPAQMPTKTMIYGGDGLRELEKSGLVKANNATFYFSSGETIIQVPRGTAAEIEISSSKCYFDADGFTRLLFELKNRGGAEVKYELRLENPGATETTKSASYFGWITPGQSKIGVAYFPRKKSVIDKYPELKAFLPMKAIPGGLLFDERYINPEQIEKIKISIYPTEQDVKLGLGSIYAAFPPVPPLLGENPQAYFPFIDSYGQFMHESWPGKVLSDDDLKAATKAEDADLAANPGPENRSKFGGWTKGPRLGATGYFRTEKVGGKWWLVDPDGYLFWSHGPTCVGFGGADTAITGKEYYFSGLPAADSPLSKFYVKNGSVFKYSQSNLYRKYGSDWQNIFANVTQQRLKSWGMNTMANWSNPDITNLRKTPYVSAVDFECAVVTWRKFPDVFSPSFRKNLRKAFQTRTETFNDPWCIGYFVQNELKFGDAGKFMEDVSADPATAPCKIEWVATLRDKYKDISKFNGLVGTSFASWDELLNNRSSVKLDAISDMTEAFYRRMCEVFFKTCLEEQRSVAPHQLYLGSRFLQNVSPIPVVIAAKYCDVVSFNVYDYSVGSRDAGGLDKPFIVGEFHFGALDRGMFGPGCRWAADQQDRTELYKDYVKSGLLNPNCVGVHWFQYNSQAFTGRTDGENFQIGLLDITGNPYPELRASIRKTCYGMYETRMSASGKLP